MRKLSNRLKFHAQKFVEKSFKNTNVWLSLLKLTREKFQEYKCQTKSTEVGA